MFSATSRLLAALRKKGMQNYPGFISYISYYAVRHIQYLLQGSDLADMEIGCKPFLSLGMQFQCHRLLQFDRFNSIQISRRLSFGGRAVTVM